MFEYLQKVPFEGGWEEGYGECTLARRAEEKQWRKKRQPERTSAESLAIAVAPSDKNVRRASFVEAVATIENASDHASMHFDALSNNSYFCI